MNLTSSTQSNKMYFPFFNSRKFLLPIFFLVFLQAQIIAQDCSSCATATCASAAITDQISVFDNVDGFGVDQECHPTVTRTVTNGDTVTFCSTFTTPAVLEENYMSFLGSIPTANLGCDATAISNWQLTSGCAPVATASFTTNEPNLPANTPRPVWAITPNTTYELCYDVTVTGSCTEISNPCFAPHWVPVPCELVLSTASQDCSANDGTYDLMIAFSNGGQGAGTYAISNDVGTLAGDDPNVVVSGTILINDIPDGSGYDVQVVGDGVVSGCNFTVVSPGYTCSFCPKIISATADQDACAAETVTLTALVDAGVEGQDYYIQWLKNGTPIADDASSTVGQDGVYGTSDDPVSALTYIHTLAFDGSVASCNFQDQVFTAQLYCKTSDELNQGNSAVGGTQAGGGVTVISNYNATGETCTNLDLSMVPAEAIAENFEYQFRVSSGPPFGNSWICEAVVNIKTPIASSGPFCSDVWGPGGCPALGSGNTCFGGPGNTSGTLLIPATVTNNNLGGIFSTTPAQGLWQICAYDSFNDNGGATEGVLNYAYLKVNYSLPPGVGVNFPNGSIVDAVNISTPAPAATAPITTSSNPNGVGLVTGIRVCNAPAEGVDFTLPSTTMCANEITTICTEAVVRYSNDNGATYALTQPPAAAFEGQTIYYEVTTAECAMFCGTQGNFSVGGCTDTDNDGSFDFADLDNDNDGILDIVESGGVDPSADADSDGIPVYLDDDDTDNSIGDANGNVEPEFDNDGDGVPNHLDLDSDNDGIYDIIEAGGTASTSVGQEGRADDNDNNADNTASNGIPTSAGTGLAAPETTAGTPDFLNLDSDDDGCTDANEAYANPNSDGGDGGVYNPSNTATEPLNLTDGTVDANGLVVAAVYDTGIVSAVTDDTNQAGCDDGDGVPAAIENAGPNGGDANDDGILDSLQANVATLLVADGTAYVTIEVNGLCNQILEITSKTEEDLAQQDPLFAYPLGLFDFKLNCVSPGDSASITYYWHHQYDISNLVYRKYGPLTPGGTDFGYRNIPVTISSAVIEGFDTPTTQYSVTDGQAGDDTVEDGEILDPSGLALILLDSDGDGVADVNDVDDDNDGIVDTIEESITTSTLTSPNRQLISDGTFDTECGSSAVFTATSDYPLYKSPSSEGLQFIFDQLQDPNQDINLTVTPDANSYLNYIELRMRAPGASSGLANHAKEVTFTWNNTQTGILHDPLNEITNLADGAIIASGDLVSIDGTSFNASEWSIYLPLNNSTAPLNVLYASTIIPGPPGIRYEGMAFNLGMSCDLDNDGTAEKTFVLGIPNRLDLDSDNDGILDIVEAGGTDVNGDGQVDYPVVGDPSSMIDLDNDGLADAFDNYDSGSGAGEVTGGTPLSIPNTDGLGNPNFLDLDSDDDGIPDNVEALTTAGYEAPLNADDDMDGIDNQYDPDFAGSTPIPAPVDTDANTTENLPDYLDLDSDDDGLFDTAEAGLVDDGTTTDTDGDGLLDTYDTIDNSTPPFDVNDAFDNGASDTDNDDDTTTSEVDFREGFDSDMDGIADNMDLDDDNDGIPDTVESGGTDPTADADGDGIPAYLDDDDTDNAIGNTDNAVQPAFDTDGDGVPNHLELDGDNDGIPDIIEAGGTDTDGDGQVDYPTPGDPSSMTDADNDGLEDSLDDTGGTVTSGTPLDTPDTDGTGNPNFLDIDSDDDGIPDNVEAQTTAGYEVPLNADDDMDGIDNQYDPDFTGSTPITSPTDSDGNTTENLPDYLDMDSDDDGLFDTAEAGFTDDGTVTDTDGDGLLDTFDDVDTTGAPFDVNDDQNNGALDTTDSTSSTPEVDFREIMDSDGDGISDNMDLDDDNDGIPDTVESGGNDPTADVDMDGIPAYLDDDDTDNAIGNTDNAVQPEFDNDGDGVPNHLDLDGDNDGILDIIEAGGTDTDGDGQVDYPTPGDPSSMTDADNDGLEDSLDDIGGTVTSGTPLDTPNTDGTGNPNFLDLDSDDDGIPDNVEAQTTAGYEAPLNADDDMDGIDNQYDPDFVGSTPITAPVDTDANTTENLPDYLDMDSDDDGLFDTAEAGFTDDGTVTDTDNDGLLDTFEGTDTNDGFDVNDALDNGASDTDNDDDTTTSEVDFREGFDSDGDGISDNMDLDDDNDGIPDTVESGGTDPTADADGDGIPAYLDDDDTDNAIGNTDNEVQPAFDTDRDGVPNHLDLDSDNDGILDIIEAGGTDTDSDGQIDYPTPGDPTSMIDVDNDGLEDSLDNIGGTVTSGTPLDTPNTDGTGNPNFLDIDSDDDGIPDNVEAQTTAGYEAPLNADDDMDGIDNQYDPDFVGSTPITAPVDTDANTTENLPDYLDMDSDDDGLFDTAEAGFTDDGTTTDTDNDGLLDTFEGTDTNDGFDVNDALDNGASDTDNDDDTTTSEVDFREGFDSDGDGISDNMDLDDDNDGIPDTVESGGTDPTADADGDGIPAYLDDDDTDNAIGNTDNEVQPAFDTDRDGVPNHLDLDSDNDGILDIIEAGGTDTDSDGQIDYPTPGDPTSMIDVDNDGLEDSLDNIGGTVTSGTPLDTPNTDGTGNPNFLDIDSDDDGISDLIESGSDPVLDADNDGMIDSTTDMDGDGIIDEVDGNMAGTPVTSPTNTDGDTVPDYIDLDADNDGINDVEEAGGTDADGNGIIDVPGTLIAEPTDTDGDGNPDFQEIDSDDDGVNDIVVSGAAALDPDNDGMIDDTTDPDGDGIVGLADALPNTFGDAADNDNDGIPDNIDIDDDNDGIPDLVEQNGDPLRDTDGDGIIDSFDLDSDNDGIPDILEAGGVDADGNGIVDDLTDTDGDGLVDVVDANPTTLDAPTDAATAALATTLPTPDSDGDGAPDFQDVDSDNDGISDLIESGSDPVLDADNDGELDSTTDMDGDGIIDAVDGNMAGTPVTSPTNTDGDTVPDYIDLDADNDGINDVEEAGGTDADSNGIIDTPGDLIPEPTDTDGDDVPDYQEIDSDDDGVNDIVENRSGGLDTDGDGMVDDTTDPDGDGIVGLADALPNTFGDSIDTDNDGIVDAIDIDDDNDGIPDSIEDDGSLIDSDDDGIPDFLDLDSDNDGIPDIIEAQATLAFVAPLGTDSDMDGLDDAYDSDNGGTAIVPVNTDEEDLPDYLDLDSDNDDLEDVIEAWDIDSDGIAETLPSGIDTDNDGIDDAFDTDVVGLPTDFPDAQVPGDDRDWRQVGDTDGDGVPDQQELLDGTNVNDPCDFLIASMTLDQAGDYLVADCDGDGVTNGDEIADGTNPEDPCDFEEASVTLDLSGDYLISDCDGDGVINGTEMADGTDPSLPCDFVADSITLDRSGEFLTSDCDEDGIPNSQEVVDGTDFFDPCSALGGTPPNGVVCDIEIANELLTPNGDGVNDVFGIRYIESYPDNTVEVFNRWGVKVYSVSGYDNQNNAFRGMSGGRATLLESDGLPAGVYFYIIKYNDEGTTNSKSGYIYLNQ